MEAKKFIEEIKKEEEISPKGWKTVELNYLNMVLNKEQGDVLIVGERGSEDGILATVLHNKDISRPVHCIDIQAIGDIPENQGLDLRFGERKVKEGEMEFFHDDVVTWNPPKVYDHIVCMNVLEHFGFDDNGDYVKQNYDLQGFEKMLRMCKRNAIFTMPFDPFIIGDCIEKHGQIYAESRVGALNSIARRWGFQLEHRQSFINVNKSSKFYDMEEYAIPSLYSTRVNHEYLIFLLYTRIS